MEKKITAKRIFAIIGIVILLGLYIASLIISIVNKENAKLMFTISIVATIVVPIIIFGIQFFGRKFFKGPIPGEKVDSSSTDKEK